MSTSTPDAPPAPAACGAAPAASHGGADASGATGTTGTTGTASSVPGSTTGSDARTGAEEDAATGLYLDLLKKVLTNLVYRDPPIHRAVDTSLAFRVADPSFDEVTRSLGADWPSTAHTMTGVKRLAHLQECMDRLIRDGVEGDFAETGVWRGGSVIFMQAYLAARGITDRMVWAADTFSGMPEPDESNTMDREMDWHALNDVFSVSLDTVRETVRRYGLDPEAIRFLPGRFRDTLPSAPVGRLALLRIDGGSLEATADALEYLYPKVAPGGYVVIGDLTISGARKAASDYRRRMGIHEPLEVVDTSSVFWRRS